VGRNAELLASLSKEVEARQAHATSCQADLSDLDEARALGSQLADLVAPGTTLIHNAGMWPTRRELVAGGLERAFVVNHLSGLLLQRPLLEQAKLARVMVVSAGLITKGSFDPERTPTGEDFSRFRTYCTTKLCFAVAERDVARANPNVDFVVLHPGIVNTELGATTGILGALVSRIKRRWESTQTCAQRLARIVAAERWSDPGHATWRFEETVQPWPKPTNDAAMCTQILMRTRELIG
jgi:NAD(P)-dependent dehydrogenase (short-subunit alcohol dehydrogenase family)